MKKFLTFLLLATLAFSCSYRPIFNPNEKYRTVGEIKAQEDSSQCSKEADDYLKESKKRRIAKEGVRQSVWTSIFGGIFGFLIGGDVKGLAVGVAAGAGIGAVSGAGSVAAEDHLKPDQIKQRYVTNCLGEKGYEILGWE